MPNSSVHFKSHANNTLPFHVRALLEKILIRKPIRCIKLRLFPIIYMKGQSSDNMSKVTFCYNSFNSFNLNLTSYRYAQEEEETYIYLKALDIFKCADTFNVLSCV